MNSKLRSRLAPALALASLLFGTACGSGSLYQPSRAANFDPDGTKELDDTDIARAFAAKPQLGERVNVAYYTYDQKAPEEERKASQIGELLAKLPGVASAYHIPALLVTGERRYDNRYGYVGDPREVSVKKLRLLAARAQADVLVVFDYGGRWEGGPNGLAALGPLLVPVFFAPMNDIEVRSYVDVYVIDTRNGYLYGHLQAEERDVEHYINVFSIGAWQEKLQKKQWPKLAEKTSKGLSTLLASERLRSRTPAKAPEVLQPAAQAPSASKPPL